MAAVDGVVDAREEEATAVALVVVFGTLMIPAVPLPPRRWGCSRPRPARGPGSIHEVAQVVAAGGAIGGSAPRWR